MFLRRIPRMTLVALAAAVLCTAALSVAGQKTKTAPKPAYVLTNFGGQHASDGTFLDSQAYDLTEPDAGGVTRVVGYSRADVAPGTGSIPWRAYVWSVNSAGVRLGTLDLGTPAGAESSYGHSINDDQWVVGAPEFVSTPAAGMQALPSLGANPVAINNFGVVVGVHGGSDPHGVLWQLGPDGAVTGTLDLGTFLPDDVNDLGEMAGEQEGQPVRAWFDADDTLQVEPLPVLAGHLGGRARAINNLGEIVGESHPYDNANDPQAVVWRPDQGVAALPDLGGGTSSAYGINDRGQIVGWSGLSGRTSVPSQTAGVLWSGGTVANVNTLAGISSSAALTVWGANAINESGQIAGVMIEVYKSKGYTQHGGDRAVLLSPTP